MRSGLNAKMETAGIVILAATIALCGALPIKEEAVAKDVSHEVLFGGPKDPQELVLKCAAGSSDAKNIEYSWQKNGQPLEKTNTATQHEDSLVFKTPQSSDEGLYQCFAKSDLGVATSQPISVKKIFLTVQKEPLKNHKPVEGRVYRLDCPTPVGYPKPTVKWVRQKQGDTSEPEPAMEHRITQGPDNNLYFSNVTQNDIYKYSCLVQSPAIDKPVVAAEHVIETVLADKEANKGEVVPQYLSKDIVAKAGDVTRIYCIFGGTPLAYPDWFFEGKNVNNNPEDRITRYNRSGGKRLLIKDTYLSDQGKYTCNVDNEVGKPESHSIYLTVVSEPSFSEKPEQKVTAKEGQDITIPCQVKGVNTPTVSWTYNAKPLSQSDRVLVSSLEPSKDVTVADLIIKNVQRSDKGYYGCKAVNENGDIYAETLLIVA